MGAEDDMSDYERLRLENIKRNEAFLASLGLQTIKPAATVSVKDEVLNKKRKAVEESLSRKRILQSEPVRRSSRVAGIAVKNEIKDAREEDEDDAVGKTEQDDQTPPSYQNIPETPEELGDYEFQAFLNLKKWRLMRSRELVVEAYKVFQSRTLCEFIRRRRNCADWGHTAEEMVECWGIGPVKVRLDPEPGFAWELKTLLDAPSSIADYLASSREKCPLLAAASSDTKEK